MLLKLVRKWESFEFLIGRLDNGRPTIVVGFQVGSQPIIYRFDGNLRETEDGRSDLHADRKDTTISSSV